MKRRKTVWMLAACMGVLLISGCGGEQQKIFSQAEEDLEQGNYAAALEGFPRLQNRGIKLRSLSEARE